MTATQLPSTANSDSRTKVTSSAGTSISRWGWLTVITISLYLLFNHGCHADVDDEPGLVPQLKSQSKLADDQ